MGDWSCITNGGSTTFTFAYPVQAGGPLCLSINARGLQDQAPHHIGGHSRVGVVGDSALR